MQRRRAGTVPVVARETGAEWPAAPDDEGMLRAVAPRECSSHRPGVFRVASASACACSGAHSTRVTTHRRQVRWCMYGSAPASHAAAAAPTCCGYGVSLAACACRLSTSSNAVQSSPLRSRNPSLNPPGLDQKLKTQKQRGSGQNHPGNAPQVSGEEQQGPQGARRWAPPRRQGPGAQARPAAAAAIRSRTRSRGPNISQASRTRRSLASSPSARPCPR